jgi:hypothetical protein
VTLPQRPFWIDWKLRTRRIDTGRLRFNSIHRTDLGHLRLTVAENWTALPENFDPLTSKSLVESWFQFGAAAWRATGVEVHLAWCVLCPGLLSTPGKCLTLSFPMLLQAPSKLLARRSQSY